MIYAKITIREIDYEKSFVQLFPAAMKKCEEMEDPGLVIRFLRKMGHASMTAALGILGQVPQRGKEELLCGIVNLYSQEIRSALNGFLEKDDYGKNVRLGNISMERDAQGCKTLSVRDIEVNYSGLMKEPAFRQAMETFIKGKTSGMTFAGGLLAKGGSLLAKGADLAARLAADTIPDDMIEKGLLSLAEMEQNKARLLSVAAQKLEENGLCLELEDIALMRESSDVEADGQASEPPAVRGFADSAELEEVLLDTVVGYLKKLIEEKG
ncbi:MAG: hypothetical protein K1W28_06330 [Lachnospiraceae bacterium]